MKRKTRKIGLATLSLMMATVLSASITMQAPVQNMQNGLGGSTNTAAAYGQNELTKMSDEFTAGLDNTQFFNTSLTDGINALNSNDDGSRRIIVEFASKSQLELYLESQKLQKEYADFTSYVNARAGKAYAEVLTDEQNDFFKALKKTDIDYEYRHTYTSILNAVSLEVETKDVEKISKIDGVKNIILSEVYSQPTVEPTINVVDVYGTGIYDSSDVAYKGDGMLVAVLDTGLDISHNAFKTMPPSEKIGLEDIEKVFNRLDANTMSGGKVTAEDVYYNAKVPFAYDYADKDADVFAVANSHGVHVAGIIAGQDETVTEADDKAFQDGETFIGVAPNAQLMIGKVFSDVNTEKGAQTDDILAAVADCVVVGADVINMSLGMSCGFSREADGDRTNEIYDAVYAAGINLVVAAGNEFSAGLGGAYGSTNLTSNPDSSTVGSPSTYYSSLSVASISGKKSSYMQLDDGTAVYFNESSMASGQQGKFVEELLGGAKTKELRFVVVPGYGRASNYTSKVKAELAKGNCIAVVSRGETSFEEKQKVAYDNKAVGCIIYNNMSGKISASLGTGKKIPTCTVSASIGQRFVSLGTGSIYLDESYKAGPFMSDFSSWGPTNDLRIKPEITAHGGEITSAVVGGYAQNSGTSMAAPNMAGAVTLLRQHVSQHYGLTGIELANRVNQLLMSTATIVYDENGLPYAVRKQGAGLGDIGKAISTDAYLYVENSTKTKIELGDDAEKTGVYTMHFRVHNTSSKTKTYELGVLAMTESVSIDNITVEEKAYMLDNAQKSFLVNGSPAGKTVTLAAGADVEITLTLSLSAQEKAYLNENFENGIYVEGFVTLNDVEDGVDLSIPYLAFYGDWKDAPLFDNSKYEVSKDKYDSSIKDEDKTVAAVYESLAIGKAYKEYDEFYLPLGQYLYNMPNDADPGVEASVDKIAIGSSYYGIYEFYAMYMGMLRAVGEMELRVENSVTGKVLLDKTEYNVRKSHNAGPSVVEFELDPQKLGLMNNEKYTVYMTGKPAYDSETEAEETREFSFYVDYQSPMISKSIIRYEDNGNGTRNAYLDLELYDNHYPQSIQLFIPLSDTEADFVTAYPIPVKDSVRDGISKISINVTDYLNNVPTSGQYANAFGVRVDDYALNASAYLISTNTTIVDEVNFEYTYKDAESKEVTESLKGETLLLRPNQSVDLLKDVATVVKAGGNVEGKFSATMVNYTAYLCTKTDAHGIECGYVFDEIKGLTYQKGDYYYDATDGTVKKKEADDTEATFGAYTRFFDAIAEPVVKNGNRYVQPETKHFVCPKCGTEEVFGFNTRTGKITTNTFKCAVQDPMIFDVEFITDNPNVVKAENGFLYAAGEGTATVTARPLNSKDGKNDFVFYVKVEGKPMTSFIEEITVGSIYNHTKQVTRSVTGGGISVDCGSDLTLYPDFKPWYITNIPDLTWQVSDPEMAEITKSTAESARIICKKTGSVAVLISSPSNGVIGTFTIVIGEEFKMSSYYFTEYKGVGYSETYEENGVERKMLVIPANLGINTMGYYTSNFGYDGTFEDVKTLDTVVVPQGVVSIGSRCFYGSSIRRIYLPSSIEHISSSAFAGTPLEEVYWYDAGEDSKSGIEYDADDNTYDWTVFYANASPVCTAKRIVVQYSAFSGCRSLSVFDLSRATALYSSAFSNCSALEYANVSNVRYAGTSIFSGCSALKNVTLHEDTVLGGNSFANTVITKIDFYGKNIPNNLFTNAKKLEKVVLHNDVETIGETAFKNCTSLTEIEFKGACQSIGASAFYGCTKLKTFTLPSGLETVGANAFEGCSALTNVYVNADSDITSVGADVFKGCTSLKKVELLGANQNNKYASATKDGYSMVTNGNGTRVILAPASYPLDVVGNVFTVPTQVGSVALTEIGVYAYASNGNLKNKEVVIPEGITTIGKGAFQNTGITKVIIPASVTQIDEYAFANCAELETVIFLCDLTEIPAYAFDGCVKLTNVQIPASVESIGKRAFAQTNIRKLDVGENAEIIDYEAFRDCQALTELNFAKQSNLRTIGQAAFAGCVSLKEVTMPNTVSTLGYSAFVGCSALETVYVSSGLEYMADYVFSACPSLTTFVMGDGAKMLGAYAFYTPAASGGFYYHNSLKNVTIPDSVESIGAYAFAGNTVMETLTLKGVKTIGSGAFCYATAINEIVTTDVLERIEEKAFLGSGIRYITLSNVEYFGAESFAGTDLYLGSSKTIELTSAVEIGAYAFYNSKGVQYVKVPAAEKLGDMAFGSETTSAIRTVTLGDKLVSMGATVFYNSMISRIALPATLKEMGYPAFTGCSVLSVITVDAKNKTFFVDAEFGGLYKKLANDTYELVAVPNNIRMDKIDENYKTEEPFDYQNLEPFKILEGTSRIGDWAMGHCKYIHAVEIPASVKSIGSYAFYNVGYGVLEANQKLASTSRVPFTKFIFKGLQAPTLEASYQEDAISLDKMYATFVYTAGYLMSDMIIPVNAKGFESLMYQFFFMEKHYSEELIEADTKKLLDWLETVDVDALTAADQEIVKEMNMIFFMMTDTQKAFIPEDYVTKLNAAVEKFAATQA